MLFQPLLARVLSNRQRIGQVLGLLVLIVFMAACTTGTSAVDALANNQRILASCDRTHPPATWVDIDGTGSSAATNILNERMTALQSIVQQTAVCSGYLKVEVFSASSIATTTLFDGSVRQPGATDNARLQRVPGAVSAVMATVRAAYAPAVKGLGTGGSDITGQYTLASQWFQQLGGTYQLHVDLLTDGFQTVGVDLTTHVLDQQEANTLASQTAVPQLPGAIVTVAGIGRVTGSVPSSDMVDGLVSYYSDLCHRMAAARCVSVSDFQQAGW